MFDIRRVRGFAAAFALFSGTTLLALPSAAEVRIWSPGSGSQDGATSSVEVWSPTTIDQDGGADVPAGVDDAAPAANDSAPPPPPQKDEGHAGAQEWSVTTVTPSYRHYRLRRALGQRYPGFNRQYRGQRYPGFRRSPRIPKYRVQKSIVKVIPAERRIKVINKIPVPHRRGLPGPVAVVPTYADLPDTE